MSELICEKCKKPTSKIIPVHLLDAPDREQNLCMQCVLDAKEIIQEGKTKETATIIDRLMEGAIEIKSPNRGIYVFEKDLPPEGISHQREYSEPLHLPPEIRHKLHDAKDQGLQFQLGLRWDIYGGFAEGIEVKTGEKVRSY